MGRDCKTLGHVRVGLDPECLVCKQPINRKEHIGLQIPAPRADHELPADSIASIEEWPSERTKP